MTLLHIPGPVDPHVHLRDLEWSHKSTFQSETAAALAGGYWAVLDMPNTPPPTTTRERLTDKQARLGAAAHCDFGIYYGAEQDHAESYDGIARDAIGMKMFCDATTGDLLVDDDAERGRLMALWGAATPRPLAVHAEGAAVDEMLAHVRTHRVATHFCHITEVREISSLREAKAEGLPVSAGVTPHHLYLSDTDGAAIGVRSRVKPPLKSSADISALWAGIADGTVDVVESDHAPHTQAEKDGPDAAYGLPGLETTLPLLGLALHEGRITAERLIELVATNAQRIFGLAPRPGTVTVLDTDSSYVIDDAAIRSATGWSPFSGTRVWGRVTAVHIDGRLAFDGEDVISEAGDGRNLAWS